MQRSGYCYFKRFSDLVDHQPHILVHLMVAKTDHAIAAFQQPFRTARIIIDGILFEMLRPVEFDDETLGQANEVDDVGAERRLPTELVGIELPSSQESPQFLLCSRGLTAEAAGEVALVAVSVYSATL
jgi:hypothetical protein